MAVINRIIGTDSGSGWGQFVDLETSKSLFTKTYWNNSPRRAYANYGYKTENHDNSTDELNKSIKTRTILISILEYAVETYAAFTCRNSVKEKNDSTINVTPVNSPVSSISSENSTGIPAQRTPSMLLGTRRRSSSSSLSDLTDNNSDELIQTNPPSMCVIREETHIEEESHLINHDIEIEISTEHTHNNIENAPICQMNPVYMVAASCMSVCMVILIM